MKDPFKFLKECFCNTPVFIPENDENTFHIHLDYSFINIDEDIIIRFKDNAYVGTINGKKWRTFDNEYYAFKMLHHRCDIGRIERIIRTLIFNNEFDFDGFCKKYLKDHPEIKELKDLKYIH